MLNEEIIIVEDDDSSIQLIEILLRKWGLKFVTFSDGEHALEYLTTIDEQRILLLDLKLPGVHGLDIIKYIKNEGKDIKIIVMSAHVFGDEKNQANDLGVEHFIDKPVQKIALKNALSDYLDFEV